MNTQKHTPGPWANTYGAIMANGRVIANIPSGEDSNAALISAAPDLLEALEFAMLNRACQAGDAVLSSEEWSKFSAKARAAIEKATGKQ